MSLDDKRILVIGGGSGIGYAVGEAAVKAGAQVVVASTNAERVKAAGGRIFAGPLELPGGSWIARCMDPQGAPFALQGTRSRDGIRWSTEWQGISSQGRLVTTPRS